MYQYVLPLTGLVVLAVSLANIRSWPFAWHARLFGVIAQDKIAQVVQGRVSTHSSIGRNPLEIRSVYKSRAYFDDCDYNFHLSNSSYPKILDIARTQAALTYFPAFGRTGGQVPIGATHFTFIKEIPLLAEYEARVSIASWDNKWIYLVIRFVTLPKKSKRDRIAPGSGRRSPPPSRTTTVANSASETKSSTSTPTEPDGAILRCISINEHVFKQGRITVPPALALACEGFCSPSDNGTTYSASNPPPHWRHVQAVCQKGGDSAMRRFQSGGWRDVPEDQRWWEEAFAGEVESKRLANLSLVQGIHSGMESAQGLGIHS